VTAEPLDARLRRLRRDGEGARSARPPREAIRTRAPAGGAADAAGAARSGAGAAPEDGAPMGQGAPVGDGPPAGRAPAGLPGWLAARLEGRRGRRAVPAPPRAARPRPLDLEVRDTAEGQVASRELRFDADHAHGDWPLREVSAVEPGAFALLTGDAALDAWDPAGAVFLDIETTGLAGGAGTLAFLVALGRFEAGGFRLWLGFLREPGEERALLAECARRIRAGRTLVTFFGKSFDRHRLEDKMRLHGLEPPFRGRPHLDLYHPLQRLYGGAFLDGRLATLEAELCGVRRVDDLPGSAAPAAWFDWLAGRSHRLDGVFRHCADDVLSLVALAAHVGRAPSGRRADGSALGGPDARRALGVARSLARVGGRPRALAWLEGALDEPRYRASRPSLELLTAELLRLEGRPREARARFERVANGAAAELVAQAWLGIAKLAERAERDPAAALDACGRARRVARAELTGRARARVVRELDAREPRLARKLGRASASGVRAPDGSDGDGPDGPDETARARRR